MGYPIVSEYKYLGVMIKDDLSMRADLAKRKKTKLNLRRKLWLIRNSNLAGTARVQLWHTLFKSRWTYAHQLLSSVNKQFKDWLKQTHYEGLINLFNMRHKPAKDKLLERAYGMPWECWQSVQNKKHFDRLGISRNPSTCTCESHQEVKGKTPMFYYLKNKTAQLLKWQLNVIG